MKFRVRFGVRLPFFPNAGILVFRGMPLTVYQPLEQAVATLKTWANGQGDQRVRELADRIVLEGEPV